MLMVFFAKYQKHIKHFSPGKQKNKVWYIHIMNGMLLSQWEEWGRIMYLHMKGRELELIFFYFLYKFETYIRHSSEKSCSKFYLFFYAQRGQNLIVVQLLYRRINAVKYGEVSRIPNVQEYLTTSLSAYIFLHEKLEKYVKNLVFISYTFKRV